MTVLGPGILPHASRLQFSYNFRLTSGISRSRFIPPRGASVASFSKVASSSVLALAALAALAPAALAQGAKARFLEQSLASPLVQTMAQRRIFEADDRVDAACREKEFLQAAVVRQPVVGRSGGVETRDWQEDWTLRRCSETIAYRVFYSEIGKGGVTVSVASHSALANPVPSVVAIAKADPSLVTLQQPPARGPEVTAIQKALIAAGYSIKADGVYGPGTQRAIVAFQRTRGLDATGSVDQRTREALGL